MAEICNLGTWEAESNKITSSRTASLGNKVQGQKSNVKPYLQDNNTINFCTYKILIIYRILSLTEDPCAKDSDTPQPYKLLQTITEAGSSKVLRWPKPIYQLGHLAAFS